MNNTSLVNKVKQKTLLKESGLLVKSTKPLLKWVGGKSYLQKDILPLIPERVVNYFDPFVGGASTLFNVLHRIKTGRMSCEGKVYASDINPFLIGFYNHVKYNVDSLVNEINILYNEYNSCGSGKVYRNPITKTEALSSKQSYYYWVRENFNRNFDFVKRSNTNDSVYISAMFYFLNQTCFRGLYKVGPRGFIVPFGHYIHTFALDTEHFQEISALIQCVVFEIKSYEEVFNHSGSNDFVYLDPPYISEDKMEAPTELKFNIRETELLCRFVRKLQDKHTRFIVHNLKTDYIIKHLVEDNLKYKEILAKTMAIKDANIMKDELIIYNSI